MAAFDGQERAGMKPFKVCDLLPRSAQVLAQCLSYKEFLALQDVVDTSRLLNERRQNSEPNE